MLLAHVLQFGWDDGMLLEDTLANKKIYPPYGFGAKGKHWTARLKVTPESAEMTVLQPSQVDSVCQGQIHRLLFLQSQRIHIVSK